MITLEQIKLLENKITRAIELIRVLKEENSTLRKGLESAQKRMKELESLVDGFKTDQREIESVIVRALQHLDELEEAASAARKPDSNGKRPSSAAEEPPRPAGPRLVRRRSAHGWCAHGWSSSGRSFSNGADKGRAGHLLMISRGMARRIREGVSTGYGDTRSASVPYLTSRNAG